MRVLGQPSAIQDQLGQLRRKYASRRIEFSSRGCEPEVTCVCQKHLNQIQIVASGSKQYPG